MQQLFQDAMSVVCAYGKPDVFLTYTCNPAWPEITRELNKGQVANDRPDLIARVFYLKFKVFLNDILKNDVLGKVKAYIYVIELK